MTARRRIAALIVRGLRATVNVWIQHALSITSCVVGEGLIFAGYGALDVGVHALYIIAVAVIVVALRVEGVQLVQAVALVSVIRVVNLSFALMSNVTLYVLAHSKMTIVIDEYAASLW
jgi:hypothetical protein